MPYAIRQINDCGIVEVRLEYPCTGEEHYSCRQEMIALCRDSGCSRVLVIFTEEQQMMDSSSTDLYSFGTSFFDAGVPADMQMAVVRRKGHVDASFVMAAARESGLEAREFIAVEKAVEWLTQT